MVRARLMFGIALVCALVGSAAAAGSALAWSPEKARYGIGEHSNVGVTMSDGTVLRVDVYYPTLGGKPASGRFPVVLTQTPYGKNAGLGLAGQSGTGEFNYLIQRGYIDVVADVRGTGDSQGVWDLFDPVEATDGATLVKWAAALPHSNGNVGLYGSSYLGIDQLMTAAAVGRRSHLKAVFPVIAGNDLYRDTAFFGGAADLEFDAAYLGLTGSLNATNPIIETGRADSPDPADTAGVELQHLASVVSYQGGSVLNTELGGSESYDEAYWMARNPRQLLARIVANRIPAFLVGGWFDLFQRGEPLNYSGFQNAFAGRPVTAPMLPAQRPTSRYQLLMGPWYHVTAGTGFDMNDLELRWFDQWLKGERTGILDTSTPLHVYELGTGKWLDSRTYPFSEAKPTTYYLAAGPSGSSAPSPNDGTLGSAPPTARSGADSIVFTGATQPCDRQSEQWSAGGGALAAQSLGQKDEPCATNDSGKQVGPGSLTYTTRPFKQPEVLAGPVDATIYATSTRPETFLEATLEDVAPGGSSTPLTSGALLGSFRALNGALSWFGANDRPILPYHPYTRASASAVPTGRVVRFDIEVFPTFAELAAGHRLRLTITTSDSPHVGFTPSQLASLTGGEYAVQRRVGAASFVELPLAPATAFSRRCSFCG